MKKLLFLGMATALIVSVLSTNAVLFEFHDPAIDPVRFSALGANASQNIQPVAVQKNSTVQFSRKQLTSDFVPSKTTTNHSVKPSKKRLNTSKYNGTREFFRRLKAQPMCAKIKQEKQSVFLSIYDWIEKESPISLANRKIPLRSNHSYARRASCPSVIGGQSKSQSVNTLEELDPFQ